MNKSHSTKYYAVITVSCVQTESATEEATELDYVEGDNFTADNLDGEYYKVISIQFLNSYNIVMDFTVLYLSTYVSFYEVTLPFPFCQVYFYQEP